MLFLSLEWKMKKQETFIFLCLSDSLESWEDEIP